MQHAHTGNERLGWRVEARKKQLALRETWSTRGKWNERVAVGGRWSSTRCLGQCPLPVQVPRCIRLLPPQSRRGTTREIRGFCPRPACHLSSGLGQRPQLQEPPAVCARTVRVPLRCRQVPSRETNKASTAECRSRACRHPPAAAVTNQTWGGDGADYSWTGHDLSYLCTPY